MADGIMSFIHRYRPWQQPNPSPLPPSPTSVITFTNVPTASFAIGSSSTFTIQATGYPAPTFTESGSLPTGVTFASNSNGTATLSGTPTGSPGTYNLTITASNGVNENVTQSFTLTTVSTSIAPQITSSASATFTVGSTGSFNITSSGNPTPTLSESGTLPSGVSFVNHGNGTATLSGTPATGSYGNYSFTITASNGVSPNATQTFSLVVQNAPLAPQITSSASASITVGVAGTFEVTTTGIPTPGLSISGTLPSGITFVDNENGTGTLSGTPASNTIGIHSFTIIASNGVSPNANQTFDLTISGVTNYLSLSTSGGVTELLQRGQPFVFKGVTVWGLPDHITNYGGTGGLTGTGFGAVQYQNRTNICSTLAGWGCNIIRLRTLASDAVQGTTGPTGMTYAQYVAGCVAWRNAAVAQGMYIMFTDWDPQDGPYANGSWAGQANRSNGPFELFTSLLEAMPNDPWVIYDPFNEPDSITQAQWYTNMSETWQLFRTNGYTGILVADPNGWANSGPGGSNWVSTGANSFTSLETYDASLLGSTQHQTAFSKHDYANEYSGTWSDSSWLSAVGGGTGEHAVFESEIGNYNGSGTTNYTWNAAALSDLATKNSSMPNFIGWCGFLFGNWADANAMTTGPYSTTTQWGGQVQTYIGQTTEPNIAPVNLSTPVASGTVATGDTLTCTSGTWSGNPTSYSYQWYYGSSAITGATSTTYIVQSNNLVNPITCRVTATNIYGSGTASTLALTSFTTSLSGSTVNVTVNCPSSIVNVTLEESGTKVASDVTPVGGVASWSLTTLSAGTQTLQAQGWNVPSGQTGSSTPILLSTVTVPTSTTPQPVGISGSWNLIFDDEFNGTELNTDIWTPGWFETPISDPVNGAETNAYNSDNVSVSGGNLVLELTDVSIKAPNGNTYPYTASLVSSNPNGSNTGFVFTYGVVEYRVYMPGGGSIGNGFINWPAAWATSVPDDTYNEFDLFEALSGFAAWHFHDSSEAPGANTSVEPGWHVISVEWSSGSLTYRYDGTVVGTVTNSGIVGSSTYLILNHSVNTNWTPATFGNPFLVDYARVWQAA